MCHSEICAMLPTKCSSTSAKRTHVQEKEDSIVNEYSVLFYNFLRVVYALHTVQDTSTKNAKVSSATSRIYAVADDSWADSHLVSRILNWLLTEEVEKFEKGQILWVHTYPTTSSRPRGRRVQNLVEIGSEMWICIRYKQTNTNKNHFNFIYKI
jgi:hypothetical protein